MLTKYLKFFPTLFVKTTDFQLVFNFEQMRTVTRFREHIKYNSSYIMMDKLNQSSRIALSNDSVFNNSFYYITFLPY